MAHEIAHVLEGICRHSREGVMKAHWTDADLGEMFARPLPFSFVDAELIHTGFSRRQELTAQGAR
jgi:hypothetical protein